MRNWGNAADDLVYMLCGEVGAGRKFALVNPQGVDGLLQRMAWRHSVVGIVGVAVHVAFCSFAVDFLVHRTMHYFMRWVSC